MGYLINPMSLRLANSLYWNNIWCVSCKANYSYLNMVDYILYKYLSFMWGKLRWFRKSMIMVNYRFYRIHNKLWINFFFQHQDLRLLLLNIFDTVDSTMNPKVLLFLKMWLFEDFFCYFKYYLQIKLWRLLKAVETYINIVFLAVRLFTSKFLTIFLKSKLLARFPVRHVMYAMCYSLKLAMLKRCIYGFKLLFSGRFTRRGRAMYYWKIKGRVPFNSITRKVDYNLIIVKLLNSICGVKVWIFIRKALQKIFIF